MLCCRPQSAIVDWAGFAGQVIVKQYLKGMDSLREFVKGVILSIPDDAGEEGPNGMLNIAHSLSNPERKRRRDDSSEPKGERDERSGDQEAMDSLQRGFKLIAAMQPDAGNELLHDLDDFLLPP